MEKAVVERLPYGRETTGAKRWNDEKGEFVQVAYKEEMRHLAICEIRRGLFRGSHYHEKKEEIFYVVYGRVKTGLIDLDTLKREEYVLEKGDKIRIRPRCGHIFYGLEDAFLVEYSPQDYDPDDSYRFDLEAGVLV